MKRNIWWVKDDIDENLRQHELSIVIVYDYLSQLIMMNCLIFLILMNLMVKTKLVISILTIQNNVSNGD